MQTAFSCFLAAMTNVACSLALRLRASFACDKCTCSQHHACRPAHTLLNYRESSWFMSMFQNVWCQNTRAEEFWA